jgi:predicted HicB family RNase H-like nuclease
MNILEYSGYRAEIEFSAEDDLLVGKVADVDAVIMFAADNVTDLKAEFEAAIDTYLSECEQSGMEPEKSYKGSFNVRVGSECHRVAARTAVQWGVSLNELVRIALAQLVDRHRASSANATLVEDNKFQVEAYPASSGEVELSSTTPYVH